MFEHKFCEAIKKRVRVKLHFDDDIYARAYEPYVVYTSLTGKTLVGGLQIANPEKPEDKNTYHNFDLAKVRTVTITDIEFPMPRDFNKLDARYRNGILCHVRQNGF